MKKILFIICLLPSLAFAEHHRGHSIARIQDAIELMELVKINHDQITADCDIPLLQENGVNLTTWGVVLKYTNLTIERSEVIIDLLSVPVVDLDDIRRRINQPDDSTPQSILKRMRVMSINTGTVQNQEIGAGTDCDYRFRGVLMKLAQAWDKFDQAAWHINDAIREEIYGDPDFICSGPNNHCE